MAKNKVVLGGDYQSDYVAINNAINDVAESEIKEITLDSNKSSTDIKDLRCSSSSMVVLSPITADSTALTGVYIVTAHQKFTVFHSVHGSNNLKFKYIIFN
mgnify:CR=1 FL=1